MHDVNAKAGVRALVLLVCLALVRGRSLLDVQVQAPGTSVSVRGGSPPSSPSSLPAGGPSPPASPAPCTPVSVTAPYTNVQVQMPCTPSPLADSKSNPSPSPSPSPTTITTTASVTLPAVSVQAPFTNVQVGRKLRNVAIKAGPWAAVDDSHGVHVKAPYTNLLVPGRKLQNVVVGVGVKKAIVVRAPYTTVAVGRKLRGVAESYATVNAEDGSVYVADADAHVDTGKGRKLQNVNVFVNAPAKDKTKQVVVDPALVKVDIASIVGVDVNVGRRLIDAPTAAKTPGSAAAIPM